MSTLTTTPPAAAFSVARRDAADRDRAIPLTRLVNVELRKASDTRAGRWLLGTILVGTAVVMTIMIIVGLAQDRSYELKDLVQFANFIPMGLLLPVVGVLAVTSEWSQRTNVVSFTLEPRRGRVIKAKLVSGAILAVIASLAASATGLVALGVFDLLGGDATWNLSVGLVTAFVLLHLINVLAGFAFGMLLLNTPAALVAFSAYTFMLPTLFEVAASQWGWAESIRPWIDMNNAQSPLGWGTMAGIHWGQFAVTTFLWFVVPVVLGVRRAVRAEIK